MKILREHHDPCLCHPTGLDHRVNRLPSGDAGGRLRVLTLNIRHGRGFVRGGLRQEEDAFRGNIRRVAEFLRQVPVDVVALQEADGPSFWSGRHHHAEQLHRESGYRELAHGIHFTLCRRGLGMTFGTALLSQVPLREVASSSFRSRPFDPKGYVVASVALDGRIVDVVSVHLDLLHSFRKRQVEAMIRELGARGNPLIVMGDLNSNGRRRWSAVQRLEAGLSLCTWHADHGLSATFPAGRPVRRLDWILASRCLAIRSWRHIHHEVSDHLAVMAEVEWLTPPAKEMVG